MRQLCKSYLNDTSGNFAIMTAVFMGTLLFASAAAIETSRMVNLKSELQNMADSGALIGAYSARVELDNREERVRENIHFNQANISDTELSANAIISFDDNAEEVTVEIPGSIPSFFSGLLGEKMFEVNVSSVASYKTQAVDPVTIAFALDVSGSMNRSIGPGGAKIDVLKQSVGILFDELEAGTPDADLLQDSIRTGMSAYNRGLVDTQPMNWGWTHLEASIDALNAGGGTNSEPALNFAYTQIKDDRYFRVSNDPDFQSGNHREYVIFMTDGDNNEIIFDEDSAQVCLDMRNDGIELFSIAFASPEKGEVLLLDCASWNDGVEKLDAPGLETYAELDLNPDEKCAKPGGNGLGRGLENGNNGNGKALGHCTAKEAKEKDKSEYYFDAEDAVTFQQAFARIGNEIANFNIRTKS